MTAPWLPTAKSHWVNFKATWGEVTPDAWPKGMFKAGSEAEGDNTALGQALGEARELLEWIKETIWPQRDDDALWLARWESAFLLAKRATTALRKAAILGRLRAYGSGSNEDIKAVFAEVFGGDPADVSFTSPTGAQVTAGVSLGETTYVRANNQMHIHSTNGDIDPDRPLGLDLIEYAAPTWQEWTIGRYGALLWTTQGEYDQSTWG